MHYREKLLRLEYMLHKRLEYKTLELEKAVKCKDETARISALSSAHEISYLIYEIERILNEDVPYSNRNDNRFYNWFISRESRQQNKRKE